MILSYDELRGDKPKEYFDLQLRLLHKQKKIARVPNGYVKYTPPPKDEPLTDWTGHTHPCLQCGGPVARKSGKFCNQECRRLSMVYPKPPCPCCGKPLHRLDRIFCSAECRRKGKRF